MQILVDFHSVCARSIGIHADDLVSRSEEDGKHLTGGGVAQFNVMGSNWSRSNDVHLLSVMFHSLTNL
jgi:hypothetical protein